jgi:superfamily II DNA or RNA helicase
MQILHVGDLVRARSLRWRVSDVRAYTACRLVTLVGAEASNAGHLRHLLLPFDIIEPIARRSTLRMVGRARWRRALRSTIAGDWPAGSLASAAGATIDLLPYQLEPALAVIRGRGSRVLIADDVGLGKTVQAALVVAELHARQAADRVLVLTPPGLRDQWAQELRSRFHLAPDVVDARRIRERVAQLSFGVNPWDTWPLAISSIEYVKRPAVLHAAAACWRDVLIVDEAHAAAAAHDRHEAVARLASRAAVVVLLTATPHNGDTAAFRSLCGIGDAGDGLLVFRRTRRDAGFPVGRRVHRLVLRLTPEERRMHRLLAEFADLVRRDRGDTGRDVWLALGVLHKRAFSGAHALGESLARRLAVLSNTEAGARQMALPLGDAGETSDDDVPADWWQGLALRDTARERSLLVAMAAAAHRAAASDSKLRVLVRLLARVREPVIVFTEFRDTLTFLARAIGQPAALLHGGLSRDERTGVVASFNAGRHRLLLATDAAAEGLNLHRACRTVVNLELPWNPMRLEQRIGRVDRIGQTRRVHAFHLVAGDTGEHRLLERLRQRLHRARLDVGAPDPLGDERTVARFIVADISEDEGHDRTAVPLHAESDSASEAGRLAIARTLRRTAAEHGSGRSLAPAPCLTIARNPRTRARLGVRLLTIWEAVSEDDLGLISERRVVALALDAREWPRLDRPSLDALIADALPHLRAAVDRATREPAAGSAHAHQAFVATRLARCRAIVAATGSSGIVPMQVGLFDRRDERRAASAQSDARSFEDALQRHLWLLERHIPQTRRSTLVLVLTP